LSAGLLPGTGKATSAGLNLACQAGHDVLISHPRRCTVLIGNVLIE
jgi:hypothetical protein